MKLYIPVKYLERIKYPTLNQAKAYTETYRVEFMDRRYPDKGWHKFNHSREIEVLTIGGMLNTSWCMRTRQKALKSRSQRTY